MDDGDSLGSGSFDDSSYLILDEVLNNDSKSVRSNSFNEEKLKKISKINKNKFRGKNLSKKRITQFGFRTFSEKKDYILKYWDYSFYDFSKTNFTEREISRKNFMGCDFSKSILNKAYFIKCNFYSCNFFKSSCYGTTFENLQLSNSNFTDVRLINTNFISCKLLDTKFLGNKLILENCNFSNSICSKKTYLQLIELKKKFTLIGLDKIKVV